MNTGTAKPTKDEMQGIKHYMIDVINPDETFNLAKYKVMAEKCIDEILAKGKVPILVGGTGLYVNTLIDGIEFFDFESDIDYRNTLIEKAKSEGADILHNELEKIDKDAADKIDSNNIRRVARALEIYHVTGKTKTQLDKESKKEVKYNYKVYGLNLKRDYLYSKINLRVDKMMEQGLIEEVRNLLNEYDLSNTALQGLGYKEVIQYFNGSLKYDEMINLLKQETRRYAKRQLTWFRRDNRIIWVSPEEAVMKIINDI
jgi:tRNA dimethylallyltransferase